MGADSPQDGIPGPADIACLALGSRGDAEPLLVVLTSVVARSRVRARFACRPRVWAELVASAAGYGGIPPVISHCPVRDCSVAMSLALAARRKGWDPATVDGTDGISADEADAFVRGERDDLRRCALGSRLVVCNLFCLEGVHVAEAEGCPCVILSPCLPPVKGMPSGFEEEFGKTMPTLYKRLKEEQRRQRLRRQDEPETWPNPRALFRTDNCCSWDDVACWMWRLFLDDHGDWRQQVLGLTASPLEAWDEPSHAEPLPRRPVLLFGLSPCLAARVLRMREQAANKQSALNPVRLAGEGQAESAKGCGLRVFGCALLCGPWLRTPATHTRAHTGGGGMGLLGGDVGIFLEERQRQEGYTVCVGFGSMPRLGFMHLPPPHHQPSTTHSSSHTPAPTAAQAEWDETQVVGEELECLEGLECPAVPHPRVPHPRCSAAASGGEQSAGDEHGGGGRVAEEEMEEEEGEEWWREMLLTWGGGRLVYAIMQVIGQSRPSISTFLYPIIHTLPAQPPHPKQPPLANKPWRLRCSCERGRLRRGRRLATGTPHRPSRV
jgi:hypothetical protein